MTLCSQSAQGQSRRVIDTSKTGEENGTRGEEQASREGGRQNASSDVKVKLAAGLHFLAGLKRNLL